MKPFTIFNFQINISAEAVPYIDKEVSAKIFNGEEEWEGTVYVTEHQTDPLVVSGNINTDLTNTNYCNAETIQVEKVDELRVTSEQETDVTSASRYQTGTLVSV